MRYCLICAALLTLSPAAQAQELEPRTYSNVPVGVNFVAVGYAYNQGNVFLDPSVPIEDLDARLHVALLRYVRTLSLFGMPSKVKAMLPWASGHWEGTLEDEFRTRDMTGSGDARVGIETIFLGASAMRRDEFRGTTQRRVFGASLDLIVPSGQYDPSRLLNLGSNRWVVNPEIGFSQPFGKWSVEAAVAAWIFSDNDDFFGGSTVEQDEMLILKVYVVRSFRPGFWVGFGAGFGSGGTTRIDGVERNTKQKNYRFGITCAYPLKPNQGLVFNLSSGITARAGPDYDTLAMAYQFSWGGD